MSHGVFTTLTILSKDRAAAYSTYIAVLRCLIKSDVEPADIENMLTAPDKDIPISEDVFNDAALSLEHFEKLQKLGVVEAAAKILEDYDNAKFPANALPMQISQWCANALPDFAK